MTRSGSFVNHMLPFDMKGNLIHAKGSKFNRLCEAENLNVKL